MTTAVSLPAAIQGPKTTEQYIETQTFCETSGQYMCQMWMDAAGTLCFGSLGLSGAITSIVPTLTFTNEPTTQCVTYTTMIYASSNFGSNTVVTTPGVTSVITYASPQISVLWTMPASSPVTLTIVVYSPDNNPVSCVSTTKTYVLSAPTAFTNNTGCEIISCFGMNPMGINLTTSLSNITNYQASSIRFTSYPISTPVQEVFLKVVQNEVSSFPMFMWYPYVLSTNDWASQIQAGDFAFPAAHCTPVEFYDPVWDPPAVGTTYYVLLVFNMDNTRHSYSCVLTFYDTSYNMLGIGTQHGSFPSASDMSVGVSNWPVIAIFFFPQNMAVTSTQITLCAIPSQVKVQNGSVALVP